MLSRLRQLFKRYATQHLTICKPGFPLSDGGERAVVNLDAMRVSEGRLEVEGWADADWVSLTMSGARAEMRPSILRPDVTCSHGFDTRSNVGFVLEVPFQMASMTLCVDQGGVRYVYPLRHFDAAELRGQLWRLVPPFLIAMLRAAPAILRWRLSGDLAARAAVKSALGFSARPSGVADLPSELLQPAETDTGSDGPANPASAVTLVLPVYDAFDLLPDVLFRIAQHTDLPWHLVMVEDCSSDDRVRPFLRGWAAARNAENPGCVTLIENAGNLGFVRSVNTAFEVAVKRGNHVLLLNSDAFVPTGWASRLIRPLLTGDRVASVTPMSNDAEIFSVPVICQKSELRPGLADIVDATARRLDVKHSLAEVPTGVGFCMALNIEYLRRVPQFDTEFGRGYGEEVDWCQRVRALGGRHMGLANLFVEHRGGTSFGSVEKLKLVARNNAVVSTRYPTYDSEVQTFIRNDPLAGPRLALALALAAGRKDRSDPGPIPIYLAHSMGGGAEKYLEQRIAREVGAGGSAVVLRVGGRWRWQLELHEAGGQVRGRTDDFGLIKALLEPLDARRIVYSCGAGDPDPVTLPEHLLALRRGASDRIEVLFHDFFPLSPSYTLLTSDGVFAGVPSPNDTDAAHRARRPDGSPVPLADWRKAWGRLIDTADELVVFSDDSAAHVRAAYPQAGGALVLRPHRMLSDVPRVTPVHMGKPVIGVLGNIGHQKGAKVVTDLARKLADGKIAGLAVIGNIDPAYALPRTAVLHGDYRVKDIPDLVLRYGITHWLIPSIWPETFSFTTHEAIATGLPVICFDLGAQAEAVRAAPRGQVIALAAGADPAMAVLEHMAGVERVVA